MSSAVARLRQTYGDIDISSGPDVKAPRRLDGLHRRQGKARAAGAPSCRELYPMHLISVVTFLGLDELLPHQTLKRRGLLSARTDAHAGRILFISHQWLGWTTADPEGAHLRALQKLLRRLISGFGGDIEADYVTQMVYGDSDRVTPTSGWTTSRCRRTSTAKLGRTATGWTRSTRFPPTLSTAR